MRPNHFLPNKILHTIQKKIQKVHSSDSNEMTNVLVPIPRTSSHPQTPLSPLGHPHEEDGETIQFGVQLPVGLCARPRNYSFLLLAPTTQKEVQIRKLNRDGNMVRCVRIGQWRIGCLRKGPSLISSDCKCALCCDSGIKLCFNI